MPTNNFLPFCPTDTATNLLTQAEYIAATDRDIGNQPGIASAKLNNKAIRQATYFVSQVAQFVANITGANVLDDATPARLLGQVMATCERLPVVYRKYTSSTGAHDMSYVFMIASGNATIGATYTNNSVTYTVSATVAGATKVTMTGNGDPTVSGTLTKATGTGDATLTFYAFRKPICIRVKGAGAGGGGGGSGNSNVQGSDGTDTTFGTSLIVGSGGVGGSGGSGPGGSGGASTLGTGPQGMAFAGCHGQGGGSQVNTTAGGNGGSTIYGLFGPGGAVANNGDAAPANCGGGGGGGGSAGLNGSGGGGGGGGSFDCVITAPLSTYAYSIGVGGAKGTASSCDGADGADGIAEVWEMFQ